MLLNLFDLAFDLQFYEILLNIVYKLRQIYILLVKNKNLFLEFWVTATNTYKREIRLEIGVEPVSPQNIIANQDNNAPQDNKTISDFENNI